MGLSGTKLQIHPDIFHFTYGNLSEGRGHWYNFDEQIHVIEVLTYLFKRTLRYILYFFVIKKKRNRKKVGKQKRTTLENYLTVSTKAEHTYISYDPEIPLLEICPIKMHTGISPFLALQTYCTFKTLFERERVCGVERGAEEKGQVNSVLRS